MHTPTHSLSLTHNNTHTQDSQLVTESADVDLFTRQDMYINQTNPTGVACYYGTGFEELSSTSNILCPIDFEATALLRAQNAVCVYKCDYLCISVVLCV
jgi:hypothetical protein